MRTLGGATLAVAIALAATSGSAHAQTIGAGPMIGWVEDEGLSIGWEISGAWELPILHASIGGSYRPEAPGGMRAVHYVAWEPWAIVGATLGAAIDDAGLATAAIGAWEGGAFVIRELEEQEVEGDPVPALVVALAIGWRFMAGRHEIYLTPKLLYHVLVDPFT